MREIVITGVGVVSPIGIGHQAFWSSLCQQRSGVGRIERYGPIPLPSAVGGELRGFDAKQYVRPRKSLKVMSLEIQMAFAAAELAAEHAGLTPEAFDPQRCGVLLGSEMPYGDIPELADLYAACLESGQFQFEQFGQQFPTKLFPLWMLKYLPNMPACHIGIRYNAQGPTNSIVLGETSSLVALIEGADVIQRGLADVMLVGGTGSRLDLTGMMYRGKIDLTQRIDDPAAACRPFDADRDGMVNGEGAGVLILEHRQHALKRGATILARLRSHANAFGPPGQGGGGRQKAIERALEQTMRRGEIIRAEIDHVNAHGLSTVEDDRIEAQAIHAVLDEVPVTAPKSYFGHLGAGGGAVELISSVLALAHGQVPVTLNYQRSDPACPVNVIHRREKPVSGTCALSLNHARTGQVAVVAIERP